MKITKDNYNELKSKDLDNNYAKVWHVNEIRDELLANTPEAGGVTSLNTSESTVTGDVTFQTTKTNITATISEVDNSVNFNYTIPYYEIIGTITGTNVQNPVVVHYVSDSDIDIESLFDFTTIDSPLYTGTNNAVRLRAQAISVEYADIQLTMVKGSNPGYIEIPHVENISYSPFSITVGALRNEGNDDWLTTTYGIKSEAMFNLKLFNVQILP